MTKKIFKNLILFFSLFFLLNIPFCLADDVDTGGTNDTVPSSSVKVQTNKFITKAGFSGTIEIGDIVAGVIKLVLSILAIIFVVMMIFSGYSWMMAGGNEDIIKKSKSRIVNAVIGLIIVLFAYGITAFVFNNLPVGRGPGGNQTQGSGS